jgi:hypothetical protein
MRGEPLPAELSRFNGLPDLTFRGRGEWSASCPQCLGASASRYGKSDRFRIFAAGKGSNARAWCRRCGFFEWADQDGEPPTAEEIADANKERARLAELEAKRVKQKIDQLQHENYWLGWHDAMAEKHRQAWRGQGIRDELQDYFQLGYVDRRRFFNGAEPFVSPAMTIPVFDVGWQVVNVQYRLMSPPPGVGKYRFTAGLPTPLFLTLPDVEPAGPVLLVEGAKKAVVCFDHLNGLNIVAVPSKVPPVKMLKRLDDCEPVYIALDPDAYGECKAAKRIGKAIGDRARYVRLPVKPDDFFTMYQGKESQFMSYVRQATRRAS